MQVLRKTLFLAFVLGCAVSIFVSGRLSVRLIVDGAISFAFIPIVEIVAFWIVYRLGPRPVPFSGAADRFLAGNTAWLIWIVALAALAAFVPPLDIANRLDAALRFRSGWLVGWIGVLLTAVVFVWSVRIDVRLFRDVMPRPGRRVAAADVAIERVIAWSAGILYFFGIALWSMIGGWMGL